MSWWEVMGQRNTDRSSDDARASLLESEILELSKQVSQWQVMERQGVRQLELRFVVKDFAQTFRFSDRVRGLAEAEINIGYCSQNGKRSR